MDFRRRSRTPESRRSLAGSPSSSGHATSSPGQPGSSHSRQATSPNVKRAAPLPAYSQSGAARVARPQTGVVPFRRPTTGFPHTLTPNGGATPQLGGGDAPSVGSAKGSASGTGSCESPRSAQTPSDDAQSATSLGSARASDAVAGDKPVASPVLARPDRRLPAGSRPSSDAAGSDTPTTTTTIHVVCRFRPVNEMERTCSATHDSMRIAYGECQDSVCSTVHVEDSKGERRHSFTFDRVFTPTTTQTQVYEYCAAPLVRNLFQGINGTIFVYGQTGAGKTHTMMGPPIDGFPVFDQSSEHAERGLVPRAVSSIFKGIDRAAPTMQFSVKVCYVEIYMEKIRDLLNPTARNLQIHDDPRGGGVYLGGATERYVNSVGEVMALLEKGTAQKVIASTKMNEESNRAHSIFILSMEQRHRESLEYKQSRLFMVDLAGSEKVSKTHAEGLQLDEANKINQSLLYLGMVIKTLTEAQREGKHPRHVPYLNSKLTRLLQDSLGGNAYTCIVLNCSEASYNADESLSSLRFGERAKCIRNRPRVNNALSMPELKRRLEDAVREKERLATVIAGLEETHRRERSGVTVSDDSCPNVLKLRDTIFELEQKLAVELREKEVIIQDNRELFLKLHAVEEGADGAKRCKRRLAEAETSLAQLKQKNGVLRVEVDRLRIENARLTFDLNESRLAGGAERIASMQQQLEEVLAELRSSTKSTTAVTAAAPTPTQLLPQLRTQQALCERQQAQLLAQQKQLAAAREETAALAQHVELVTCGMTRSQRAHQESSSAAEERCQQLSESVEALAAQLQGADGTAAELQREAAELRQQVVHHRQRADSADAEVRQLQHLVTVLKGRVANRDERLARLEEVLRCPDVSDDAGTGRRRVQPDGTPSSRDHVIQPFDSVDRSPSARRYSEPQLPTSPVLLPQSPPAPGQSSAHAQPGAPLQRSPWAQLTCAAAARLSESSLSPPPPPADVDRDGVQGSRLG